MDVKSKSLLLDDQKVLDRIEADEEADPANETVAYHAALEKFEKDFEDIIKVCEGF